MKEIEIFEPLGLRKNTGLYKKYLPFKEIDINDFPLQSPESSSCASFCIYYIVNRFYNGKLKNEVYMSIIIGINKYLFSVDMDYSTFIETFFNEQEPEKNECIVKEFLKSHSK